MEWRDNNWRDCYSDEHYLGTLLASKASACNLVLDEVCLCSAGNGGGVD